jgi:hypothetical protein
MGARQPKRPKIHELLIAETLEKSHLIPAGEAA